MGKPPQIIAHTKLVFFILLHQTVIENVRLFVMQLVFMYEIGKYPKHSGSESRIRFVVFNSSRPLRQLTVNHFRIVCCRQAGSSWK